ncbi:MAG: DNA repair protein RadA [Thiotrichales bacterium]|nr:DNA repair protein RadA [Thiotrichales bacterium]
MVVAAKSKSVYVCNECGANNPKWVGQCPSCGGWNSLVEESVTPASSRFVGYAAAKSEVVQLSEVSPEANSYISTTISELDLVLGGGLVAGGVVLIGGNPGIGKSTLLLQASVCLGDADPSLYVTGEESLEQVSLRAHRLGVANSNVRLLAETSVERILVQIEKEKPSMVIIDSIQTIFSESLSSAPGSVAQVRESTTRLVQFAKRNGCILLIAGHVTKEGHLAGPRVLEHMVDTVLYFEGDASSRYRVLRSVKNRFGAVNEVGLFAMTEKGLKPVSNPSAIFLSQHENPVAGSAITVTCEGSRPILVEVQALVADSPLSQPRRVALGIDGNRLAMLLALLYRHGGTTLHGDDVFVNVVGGMRISETASDLAVVLSILSSYKNKPLPEKTVIFGELGLGGELRPVANGQERLKEAARHGLTRAFVPKANAPRKSIKGIEVVKIDSLEQVLGYI